MRFFIIALIVVGIQPIHAQLIDNTWVPSSNSNLAPSRSRLIAGLAAVREAMKPMFLVDESKGELSDTFNLRAIIHKADVDLEALYQSGKSTGGVYERLEFSTRDVSGQEYCGHTYLFTQPLGRYNTQSYQYVEQAGLVKVNPESGKKSISFPIGNSLKSAEMDESIFFLRSRVLVETDDDRDFGNPLAKDPTSERYKKIVLRLKQVFNLQPGSCK